LSSAKGTTNTTIGEKTQGRYFYGNSPFTSCYGRIYELKGNDNNTTPKKSKKSGESGMSMAQGPGSRSEQNQGSAGMGGQKDSPLRGQEKSPEGKSQFGESGSGQGDMGGIGAQGQGRGSK